MHETEIDDAELALLDFCVELRAYGITLAQALEFANERIPELWPDAFETDDTLH
jgi:hypothetical protein